ncbi:putative ferric-chelate reductase 1 isoform X2 [Ostrea edulis]|nr:putative ferric-chelate reductase 1 isoform X2 [Ostrea edulis]XP_048766032.2 putative ferric-chelate reductase 1 isoform X2 [Ostrea edulis]XP_048766033.2 putative ferric-chelate reductase 1 isoform X2 [Ostrea edulis]
MSLNVLLVVMWACIWRSLAFPTGSPGCRSSGAPTNDNDFVPSHGTSEDGNLPYFVNASRSGNDWTVMVWAENSYFKGFLLRVLPIFPSNTVAGSYVTMPSDTRNCSDTDATHTSADANHTSLTFVWRQSSTMTGDVYFKATIVHTKSTDYKITTSLPIVQDPECNSTKGCLSECDNGTCRYQVTWKRNGDLVRFEFQEILESGNKYQAIGFSSDRTMGDDSVMVCKSNGGAVSFELGYNSGKSYSALANSTNTGVDVIETSQTDNVIKCVVQRTINTTHAEVFNLSQPWYLLHAMGSVTGGFVGYHHTRTASITEVDFLTTESAQPPVTSTTPPTTSGISPDPECGSSKGCQFSCNGGACSYLITWQKRDDLVRFELMEMSSGSQYQAIAFSSDRKMGDDSVMACKSNSGAVSFELGYNSGKSYSALANLAGTGVNVIETSQISGRARCVVERTINSTNLQVFSLTRNWFLLRASGNLVGDSVAIHSTKAASTAQVDFLSASIVTAETNDQLMAKLHGCFMMIAWVMFSSIGIVTARYFKDGWSGKTLVGQKVWFQIHRTSMVLVFLFTVSAFVIIFVDVGEYREVVVSDGKDYLRYHPILGIVVMALTLINPIMSLFRCAPTDKKRIIFNVAHFIVGTGAHLLAAITILFGLNIDRLNIPTDASYVMYAYMAVFVFIEIAFQLQAVYEKSLNSSTDVAIEMKDADDKNETGIQFEKRPVIRKEVFLYFHILLMVALCVAMIVIVMTAD